MGYAVLHLQKGSAGAGLGYHVDRSPGHEHTYENADPEKRDKNINYSPNKYCKMNFTNAVNSRISEGYKSNRKIRTDAVKFCSAILTGSHKEMIEISKDQKKFQKWINENYSFAAEQWGAENIVRFTLHLDEKTPHIHCLFVPITPKGNLSAKEVFGNRKDLKSLQDSYAIRMNEYGLKRGLRGSKSKHETVQEYYARAEQVSKPTIEKIDFYSQKISDSIKKPSRLDILYPDKYIEKTVKHVKTALNDVLRDNTKHLNGLENENRELKKELGRIKGHLHKMQKDYGPLNNTAFELKVDKDELLFSSEGEVVPLGKDVIEKALNVKKFNTNIATVRQKIQRDIINSKLNKAIKNNNLLSIAPDQIKNLGRNIITEILNHDDTLDYVINKQKVSISFSFSHDKENQQLLLHLNYLDFENKKQEIKISSNINKVYQDILFTLKQTQISISKSDYGKEKKKGRGI